MPRSLLFVSLIWCLCAIPHGSGAAEPPNETARAPVFAQPRHPVYSFIQRSAAKGLLPNAELALLPWTRFEIAEALVTAHVNDAQTARLSHTDQSLLRYYACEFSDEIRALGADSLLSTSGAGRSARRTERLEQYLRPEYKLGESTLRVELAGGYSVSHDSGALYRRHAEVGGWIRMGSSWAAQAVYRDVAVSGTFSSPPPPFDRTPGVASVDGDTGKTYFYDDPDALVAFSNKKITASFGVFPLVIGTGRYANLVLSDKPPAFPHVRLVFRPFRWLSLAYVHAALQSGVPDTGSAWHRAVPATSSFMSKYYVAHRIGYTGIRGVEIGVGESIVYGGRGVVGRYLIPVVPFRAAQHSEGDLDNLQMWGDISLTRIPWTRLYGSLFIDELSLTQLFEDDNIHNWWAWQYGVHVTDLWGSVPDLDFMAEYTRANPWAYRHRYPWNTYDTWAVRANIPVTGYPLGFWQGHNGDYLRGEINWRPSRGLYLGVWAANARRGDDGTPTEQYNPPAEGFLFGTRTTTREIHVVGCADYVRNVTFKLDVGRVHRTVAAPSNTEHKNWTTLSASVMYGVW
jgi:hypothetical protein